MGWHSDDEAYLGLQPVIASISFGATRRFRFRHRKRVVPAVSIELPEGSLLVMSGQTQKYWQHMVPRTRLQVPARFNLTFRNVLTTV